MTQTLPWIWWVLSTKKRLYNFWKVYQIPPPMFRYFVPWLYNHERVVCLSGIVWRKCFIFSLSPYGWLRWSLCNQRTLVTWLVLVDVCALNSYSNIMCMYVCMYYECRGVQSNGEFMKVKWRWLEVPCDTRLFPQVGSGNENLKNTKGCSSVNAYENEHKFLILHKTDELQLPRTAHKSWDFSNMYIENRANSYRNIEINYNKDKKKNCNQWVG